MCRCDGLCGLDYDYVVQVIFMVQVVFVVLVAQVVLVGYMACEAPSPWLASCALAKGIQLNLRWLVCIDSSTELLILQMFCSMT